jgi:hypothetical protein
LGGLCYIRTLKKRASETLSRGGVDWIEHPLISRNSWLVHAFSTRKGGVCRGISRGLNLGFTEGAPRAKVQENRKLFLDKLGVEHFALASLRQIHSSSVFQVRCATSGHLEYSFCGHPMASNAGVEPLAGDALMTDQAGVLLSVRTADCLPVMLVDPKHRAVAVVHAGWRGAVARIVEKTVGEMRRVYGSLPQTLVAVMGPSIRACCYEVQDEVVDAFHGRFVHAEKFFHSVFVPSASQSDPHVLSFLSMRPPGHDDSTSKPSIHLDLIAVAQDQLLSAGLVPRHIGTVGFCTACHTDLFYSYRKEGSRTGRMMAVIGMLPGASHHRLPSSMGESAS